MMWSRNRLALVCALFALVLPHGIARAVNSEDGGTGLVHVDQAWSLTGKGILFSSYAGLFSDNFTSSGSRFLSLTPSITKGLGAGLEISAALHLEGLSQNLEGEAFERRIDLRSQNLTGKLRWTRPLGTTRMRIGVQGLAGLPLESRTRTGGTLHPDQAFDPGVMGLLSTNVGWFDFPVRVHLNSGYWWSRDDGAFYYRHLPTHLPLAVADGQSNDVFMAGVGIEVGLRRMEVFAEITTEHFWDARAQIHGSENLWRLTPGIRTMLSSSIALTGALSIDLSKDAPETAFDPGQVYPDVAFRVGLSLGQVLGLEQGERAWRDRAQLRKEKTQPEDDTRVATADTSAEESVVAQATPDEAQERLLIPGPWEPTHVVAEDLMPPAPAVSAPGIPAVVVGEVAPLSPATPAPVATAEPTPNRVQLLEERLGRLEMQLRLSLLETRLAMLEGVAVQNTGLPRQPLLEPPVSPTGNLPNPNAPRATPAQSKTVVPEAAKTGDRSDEIASAPPVEAATAPPVAAKVAPAVAPTPALPDVTAPTPSPFELQLAAQMQAMQGELQRLSQSGTVTQPSVASGGRGGEAPVQILVNPPERSQASEPREMSGSTSAQAANVQPKSPKPIREAVSSAPSGSEVALASPVALVSVGDAGSSDVFPLILGERRPISGIDLTTDNPPSDSATRKVLEGWAQKLARDPAVRVTLLVHGDDTDRRRALKRTDAQAQALRDYLVVSGASSGQVVPLGMGLAEPRAPVGSRDAALLNPRVEIERTR